MKTLSTLVPSLSLAGLLVAPALAQDAAQLNTARTGLVRVQYPPQEPEGTVRLPKPRVEQITFTEAPSGLQMVAEGGVQVTERPAGIALVWDTPLPVGDDGAEALKRDIELYARTSKSLAGRGYKAESLRVREIIGELMAQLSPPSIAERARKLLDGDIHDRAVRVPIIELAAEGYAEGGWETNAEVLRWFASIGRGQLTDAPMEMPPMPAAASAGGASVMDNLIELILGAAGMHKQLGNEEAAKACMRLGRFYVERGLGAFADREERIGQVSGPSIDRLRLIDVDEKGVGVKAIDAPSRLRGIGYADGAEIGVEIEAIDVPDALNALGYAAAPEIGVDIAVIEESGRLHALGYGGDVEALDAPPAKRDAVPQDPDVEPSKLPVLAVGSYGVFEARDVAVDPDPAEMRDLEVYLKSLQVQIEVLEAKLAEQRAKLGLDKRDVKGGRR